MGLLMSLTFLTPLAGLAALAALATLAAALAGRARAERVRQALRLGGGGRDRLGVALALAVTLLLALAATQPAVARPERRSVRTDAAVYVVVDVSRSMLASHGASGATRLARARADAVRIRAGLPGVPVGLATLTDRVLPLLFPSADQAAFDSTVRAAIRVQEPPPLELQPNATAFTALSALGTEGFFTAAQRRRAVVLLTDGESQPFDAGAVAQALRAPVVVERIWDRADRISTGFRIDASYRPDPQSATLAADLASATGGRVASSPGAAAAEARRALGTGASRPLPSGVRRTPLAPWVALVAVAPLGLLLRRRLLASL
jgi:hypothetical protein